MNQLKTGHVEKLAEVGKHTCELFHEMNNNFSVMMGLLELIGYKYSNIDPALKEYLSKIYNYVERSADLVQDTLGKAKRENYIITVLEINNIIKNTNRNISMLNNTAHKIAFKTSLTDLPYHVFINVIDLEHVLMNLLKNARDSIISSGKSGTIRIRTMITGSNIIIEIADTGPGIEDKLREKIFEPFFTTKQDKKGTGLGLSICREIISGYRGALYLDPDYHEGAKFIIKLPLQ